VEASFLPAIRVVELLFPPVDPVVADFHLAFETMVVCICVCFFPSFFLS
jgi:hypothetical protein